LVVALSGAGCGGVPAERFDALAAEVKELKSTAGKGAETDPKAGAVEQRLAGFESTTSDAIKKIEENLEFVQKELMKLAAPAEAGSPASAPTPGASELWDEVDIVLGIQEEGVTAEGDNYKIKARWLKRELVALSANAKGLKLADGKDGGVTIRGIKPSSLIDKLGIKNGDIIHEVNGTAVASVAELSTALRQGKKPTTAKILRKKKEITLSYSVVP
jgi:S1-C subfamily serine protease